MFKLKNKVAIITGASRGIGKSVAQELSKSGAHVVCVSRSGDDLLKISNKLNDEGFSSSFFVCDVSDFSDFKKLIDDTVSKFNRVDILVNNAGITKDNLIMRMPESDWDKVIDVNLKGVFNGIKAVARQMMKQKHGRIINISSIVGLIGNPGQANYTASKAGIIGLGKAVSKELASRNITVNSIAPGYIETDMVEDIQETVKEDLFKQIPLGRIGKPSDIATAVLYLASDEAGYVTGQTLTIDGGMTSF
jgi:3-oxoacyl-[acyl-carrier protein] reductase